MNAPAITLVVNDYDHLAPLACGDVIVEDVVINLDRKTPFIAARADPSVHAVEHSFSQFLIRRAMGDRTFVGLPIFPMRAFRHRCFFVRRASDMHDLTDLRGKRVGTNGWPDTGNTWSRAALREQGVRLDQIEWWIGPVDDPAYDSTGHRPSVTLPPNVHQIEGRTTLVNMLLAGELDAIMCPWPPRDFSERDSPIVRLVPDYRRAERAYLGRVGFYPAHHIIAVRRDVFDRYPQAIHGLYRALDSSRLVWQGKRRRFTDTTPWLLAEIEEVSQLLGEDWQPNGVEANRVMIAALCEEEFAQGLVDVRIDPRTVFEECERMGVV
ncbi:MAG: hypothetical protein ACR2M3_04635 [Thermomicrobiales bacterium]